MIAIFQGSPYNGIIQNRVLRTRLFSFIANQKAHILITEYKTSKTPIEYVPSPVASSDPLFLYDPYSSNGPQNYQLPDQVPVDNTLLDNHYIESSASEYH
jgi:hypothetical protein